MMNRVAKGSPFHKTGENLVKLGSLELLFEGEKRSDDSDDMQDDSGESVLITLVI